MTMIADADIPKLILHGQRGRACIALALGVVACAFWMGPSPAADPAAQQSVATDQPAESIPRGETPWVGVGGCAAAACHGGEAARKNGEYTTWITQDKHSQAYSVLFSDAAVRMMNLLPREDTAPAPLAHEDRLCLACHAPTGPDTGDSARLRSDGVGCEACHGGAEEWVTSHVKVDWNTLSRPGRIAERSAERRELGMTDMHDVLVRAQRCVVCHVGVNEELSVNHDLIAVGHPRLNFELGAFQAKMPKHWPHAEHRRRDPTLEARIWVVGQAVSAAKSLELTATRAEQHNGEWIEFAEFNCFSCHRRLLANSGRQPGDAKQGSVGQLAPQEWYVAPLQIWPETDLTGQFPSPPTALLTLENRRASLHDPAVARGCASALFEWAKQVNGNELWENEESFARFLSAWTSARDFELDWDHATQWYLGAVALERSRLDRLGLPLPDNKGNAVLAVLKAMEAQLYYPVDKDLRFDSPRDFDPDAFVTEMNRLARLFEAPRSERSEGGAP